METLYWLVRGGFLNGREHDYRWVLFTAGISVLVLLGYLWIAFKWFFQARFAQNAESRQTLLRLGLVALGAAVMALGLSLLDSWWSVWRLYDLGLGLMGVYLWSYAWHMRGMGLVDDRLAEVSELETRASRYREIAELLPQMVWTADAAGRVDYCNERWRQFAGPHHTWLDSIDPAQCEPIQAWWSEAVASRTPVSREIRLGGRDGYRTFLVNAHPILRGHAVKWLGACADIEDQKQLLAERENQARQRLFFLNALSHDLRAPLNNVVLNAQLLMMSDLSGDSLQSADAIVENAMAAGELVSRLLDYAKAGAQDENTFTEVSVGNLLRQIVRRFQGVLAEKKLYMRLSGLPDVVAVTDRMKLERVISNLVDNAIKFTSRGGITLNLSAAGGIGGDERVIVRVTDTGSGVPESHAGRLFDEFYQVNNHERDRRKGFGMGLAICSSLAQQLGGNVRLASTGADGSCFEVCFKSARHDRGGRRHSPAGNVGYPEEARLCPA